MWHDLVTEEEQILNFSFESGEDLCLWPCFWHSGNYLYCCWVAFGSFESNQEVMKYTETLLRCFWSDPTD